MIEKTRKQFVAITMIILAMLFVVLVASVLFVLDNSLQQKAYDKLKNAIDIAIRADSSPAIDFDDKFESFRCFTVVLDSAGNITSVKYDSTAYDIQQIDSVLKTVLKQKSTKGRLGDFYYMSKDLDNDGRIIVISDRSLERDWFAVTSAYLVVVLICGYLVLYIIVWQLSYKVVQPVRESFDKQRQFVADASHELKTPITIISASTQALKTEQGDSKWTDNIQSQTERMSELITDLLDLAKSETTQCVLSQIDLSSTVNTTAMLFDCVAFENKKSYTYTVDDGISLVGDEHDIKKIVTILIENAIKYSAENGEIKLTLTKSDRPTLTVFNTGCNFEEIDKDKLFLRFYRVDKSRARESGGSGLGLAIAKALCEKYRYKISIDCKKNEYTSFTVVF